VAGPLVAAPSSTSGSPTLPVVVVVGRFARSVRWYFPQAASGEATSTATTIATAPERVLRPRPPACTDPMVADPAQK
jgi:hypothetical protein